MPSYTLLCLGHPLLDIQVNLTSDDPEASLLTKYGLEPNNAILAGETQAHIYDEIIQTYPVVYVAGGAAQNTARGASYVLPEGSVAFSGCVGDDDLAKQLRDANTREGVESAYVVEKGERTGACAVIVSGDNKDRSLVTTLRAAKKFDLAHLSWPEIAPLVENAQFYFAEGYLLTHCVTAVLEIAKHAAVEHKTFIFNLSAPYICEYFKEQVDQVLPYVDILFGNEAEAEAWRKQTDISIPNDLQSIANALANLDKKNTANPRIVIITSGAEATTVARSDSDEVKTYPVHALAKNEIVDTNGAGDAFAGGFVGAIIAGKTVDEAVEIGHKLAAMCVGQVGPQFRWPKEKLF